MPGLVIWVVAMAAASGWHYQEAGRFSEAGRCLSAAQRGERFALGCRSGVWTGPADRLELGLPCRLEAGQGIHLRVLDPDTFIASTPCGLFLLSDDRPPERIALADSPGPLAADGRGRAVVLVGQGLVAVSRDAPALGLGRWPGPRLPLSLAWTGSGVLGIGPEVRWVDRLPVRLWPPEPGARAAVGRPGQVVWIGPLGRVWEQAPRGLARPIRRLPLEPAGRVRTVCHLGAGRVFVATGLRWFAVSAEGIQSGFLPAGPGRPLAVRFGTSSEPPWLVQVGRLLRPFPGQATNRLACPPLRSGCRLAGLSESLDQAHSPGWVLPRLELFAFGGQASSARFQGLGGWGREDRHELGLGLSLSWPLGEQARQAVSLESEWTVELTRNRLSRLERIEQLLAERERLCLAGANDPVARIQRLGVERCLAILCGPSGRFPTGDPP